MKKGKKHEKRKDAKTQRSQRPFLIQKCNFEIDEIQEKIRQTAEWEGIERRRKEERGAKRVIRKLGYRRIKRLCLKHREPSRGMAVIGKLSRQNCLSTTGVRPLLCVNLQFVSNLKERSESVKNSSLDSFDGCWCLHASCSFHSFPESLKGSKTTTWITMIQVPPCFFPTVSRTQNAQNALPKLAFVLGSEFLG